MGPRVGARGVERFLSSAECLGVGGTFSLMRRGFLYFQSLLNVGVYVKNL